jgi:phosphoglycolate phosphatase-like HAD superfamily hydrolase
MKSIESTSSIRVSKGIILWDIDGTLVTKEPSADIPIHFRALGIQTSNLDTTSLSGLTDWDVLCKYALENQIPVNEVDAAFQFLCDFKNLNDFSDYGIICGSAEILEKLLHSGWRNGILTGNTKERAIQKLSSVGLISHFEAELFFCCRREETRVDISLRARDALYGNKVFVVGDTKYDLIAAKKAEFFSIGIPRNKSDIEFMAKHPPNLLLNSLELDREKFLETLQNFG